MEDSPDSKKTSRFNEANLNILRLHSCWVNCAKFRQNAQFDKWLWELDTVWSELCQDVTDEKLSDFKDIEKDYDVLRENVNNGEGRDELYKKVNELHIFLRRLQDKVGKGGVYDDGSEEDFE